MTSFWDEITGLGSRAYDYITDTDFSGGSSSDTGLLEDIGSVFKTGGEFDYGKIAGGVAGLGNVLAQTGVIDKNSYLGQLLTNTSGQQVGYQGEIPTYTASRQQVPGTYDPNRRPGSGGQRYFTDVRYDGGDTSGQAGGLQALNLANLAQQNRAGQSLPAVRAAEAAQVAQAAQAAQAANNTQTLAMGGIAGMAPPRYLRSATDGMADKIPASIDGSAPAALSGGEFVIPADVVSGMGNGNSDAGAKNLYAMMDRVRQARTGTTKQAPAIDPNKMLPTGRA
jgi:hypothetical protein